MERGGGGGGEGREGRDHLGWDMAGAGAVSGWPGDLTRRIRISSSRTVTVHGALDPGCLDVLYCGYPRSRQVRGAHQSSILAKGIPNQAKNATSDGTPAWPPPRLHKFAQTTIKSKAREILGTR